jgi:glucose/arabinose dehydrogenase
VQQFQHRLIIRKQTAILVRELGCKGKGMNFRGIYGAIHLQARELYHAGLQIQPGSGILKKRFISGISLFLLPLLTVPILAWQQNQKANTARVEGHIYEPKKVEPTDERVSRLKLPAGFTVNKFALLANPRMIAVGNDGTVYVTQREPETLSMLKDLDKDGVADVQKVVAEKKGSHGVAIYQNNIYLATVKEVFVAPINPDGTLGALQMLINDLPDGGQHPNRTLAVGADNKLYISVGSTCNVCKETNEENAAILRADLDGKNRKVYASGLRNTIGYGWHPLSKRFFGFDHGIDWLGDQEQPEELNELTEGAKYGWPYVYAKGNIYPHGEPPHHYHFQVLALDTMLKLESGFNRPALLKALKGHVLARGEVIGTFQKQ